MAIQVEMFILNKAELTRRLVEAGAERAPLLFSILEECGETFGNSYVLLNNEHCDKGNPYFSLFELLDSAFPAMTREDGLSPSHGVVLSMRTERAGFRMGTASVDAASVANVHGTELRERY